MRDNRKSEQKLDGLLKLALASKAEPEEALNRQILRQWKERPNMKKQLAKRIYATAVACAALLVTVSAGAAVRYLKPAEVAEKAGMESGKIEAAFEGEDAVTLNDAKEAGDYRVTLLGITTSENLKESELSGEVSVQGELYAVVAIERLDGTPMPETSEDAYSALHFFVSPLIEGLAPWQYNIASMNGGYADFVDNGILYRIIACDDVSMFADRNLYLCVTDTAFYEKAAYDYEEETGTITRNEAYDGINLLFDLPIDPERADEAAGESYLKALEEAWGLGEDAQAAGDGKTVSDGTKAAAGETADDVQTLAEEISSQILDGKEAEALAGAVLLEDKTKTVTEKNGSYEYVLTLGDESAVYYFYQEYFQNGTYVSVNYSDYDEETETFTSLYIMVLTENGDGTAEVRTYYKEI